MLRFSGSPVRWRTITTTRKDGSKTEQLQATVSYRGEDGRSRRKTKLFPAGSVDMDVAPQSPRHPDKVAKQWLHDLDEEQERIEQERIERERLEAIAAKRAPDASTTVSEYVSGYVDVLEAAGTVRPSAIADYRTSCRRISEGIGDVVMCDLTPAVIQEWEADLLKGGRGTNTVLKYHRLLNSVCKHAISVRDLDWNPCSAVKKPKRMAPSPNSLTAEQHARVIATLEAMPATATITAATIAIYTGMREGEICGLKWSRYDPDLAIIRVDKAIAKAGGRSYETEPKTEAGRRDVPVHPRLARALERRRAVMVAKLEEAGVTLDDDEFGDLYVVGHVDGRYYSPTSLSRTWKAISESFDLVGTQGRRVTFHDLRHSFATRAIAAGADVKAVAAVLGHSDAHVTLNVYADADKESKARAVSLVAQSIDQQGDVEPYAELVGAESLR